MASTISCDGAAVRGATAGASLRAEGTACADRFSEPCAISAVTASRIGLVSSPRRSNVNGVAARRQPLLRRPLDGTRRRSGRRRLRGRRRQILAAARAAAETHGWTELWSARTRRSGDRNSRRARRGLPARPSRPSAVRRAPAARPRAARVPAPGRMRAEDPAPRSDWDSHLQRSGCVSCCAVNAWFKLSNSSSSDCAASPSGPATGTGAATATGSHGLGTGSSGCGRGSGAAGACRTSAAAPCTRSITCRGSNGLIRTPSACTCSARA